MSKQSRNTSKALRKSARAPSAVSSTTAQQLHDGKADVAAERLARSRQDEGTNAGRMNMAAIDFIDLRADRIGHLLSLIAAASGRGQTFDNSAAIESCAFLGEEMASEICHFIERTHRVATIASGKGGAS